jgi:hypothetical protein
MRWRLALKKTDVVAVLGCLLLASTCALVACSGGSEEVGRIRVTPAEVAGVYKLDSERLELEANGTYVQDIVSDSQPVHRTGRWRILNHLLDGSQVLLIDAAVVPLCTPGDKDCHLGFGDLPMYAHNRSGKVALARNEVADSYYVRTE